MARRLVGWSDSFLGTLSDRPLHRFSKGGSGSGGSGGSSGGGGEAQPSSGSSPELPDGVEEGKLGGITEYKFKVAGKDIEMNIEEGMPISIDSNKTAALVDFSVDGWYGKEAANLEGRDAVRAALILRRTMEYDVSRRPEGFIYQTSAFMADGYGPNRTRAYSRIGFSTPDRPGDKQYGIVRNGKLRPWTPE